MKCFEFVFPLLDLMQVFSLDSIDFALTDFIQVIELCDFFLEIPRRLLEFRILVGKT